MNCSKRKEGPGPSRAPEVVVAAVARCFRRLGYEGASMTMLAQATGLGRSSLYHHFPGGKEDMAQAALDRVADFLRVEVSDTLTGSHSPAIRWERMLAAFDTYYERGELGCLLGALSLADCPPAISCRVKDLTEFWIETLAAFLAQASVADARDVAERQVALIQGALVVSAATRDPRCFQQVLKELAKDRGLEEAAPDRRGRSH